MASSQTNRTWPLARVRSTLDDLLGKIVEAAPVALVLVDPDATIVLVNEEAERLFGYGAKEMTGQPIELLVPPRYRPGHIGDRSGFLATPQTRPMGATRELFALRKDGTEIPVEIALKALQTRDGAFVMAVVVDMTERKHLERRFEMAVDAAPIAMLMLDAAGHIIQVNREAQQLYGYARSELIGCDVDVLAPPRQGLKEALLREPAFEASASHPGSSQHDLYGLHKDGTRFPIEVGRTRVSSEAGNASLLTVVDVSESRRLEAMRQRVSEDLEQRVRERTSELARANLEKEALLSSLQAKSEELERLSREDPLTRLANRRDFDERLNDEIRHANRFGTPLAVAMIDLDYFKRVNDLFGHAVGDAVLREAANLVRQQCRAIDAIGRYGGDEFALALPGCDLCTGIVVCERIRSSIERFDWDRIAPGLTLTVSAGISASGAGSSGPALLNSADNNLYEAKRQGRNRVLPELPAVAPA